MAVAIAGGRFDPERSKADCAGHPQLAACRVYRELGAGRDAASRAALGQNLEDLRVKAVVSLDLGLARGFAPASLARIEVPILVVAAGQPDPLVPAELESHFLVEHLPAASTRHAKVATAAHFSFLPLCKPGAVELLEQDTPGDGIVCQDGQEGVQPALHEEVAELIIQFLAATLPTR